MLCAATALGIDTQRCSKKALTMEVLLETPRGRQMAWVLIDSGVEHNFISQKWVKMYLPSSSDPSQMVKAIDGHKV